MIDKSEIYDEIEWQKEGIAETQELMEKGDVADEQIPGVYYRNGISFEYIGLFKVLLGETEESKSYFKKSAKHYYKNLTESMERDDFASLPHTCMYVIYNAVLSSDPDLAVEHAKKVKNFLSYRDRLHDSDFTVTDSYLSIYFLAKSLAAAVLEKPDEASGYLDQLDTEALPEVFNGLPTCIEGLIAEDEKILKEGLEQVLNQFIRERDDHPPNPENYISLKAVTVLRLANQKGIDVNVEKNKFKKFIPGDLVRNDG